MIEIGSELVGIGGMNVLILVLHVGVEVFLVVEVPVHFLAIHLFHMESPPLMGALLTPLVWFTLGSDSCV